MASTSARPRGKLARSALAALVLAFGCAQDTSRLTTDQESRFASEGILRRADNVLCRYTHQYGFRREETRENRLASIIVTRQTVFIHKNERIGLEITPRTRRAREVHRREDRVRISVGSGPSEEIWSFVPPDDPEGWTADIRAVIRASRRDSSDIPGGSGTIPNAPKARKGTPVRD